MAAWQAISTESPPGQPSMVLALPTDGEMVVNGEVTWCSGNRQWRGQSGMLQRAPLHPHRDLLLQKTRTSICIRKSQNEGTRHKTPSSNRLSWLRIVKLSVSVSEAGSI